MLEEALVSGLFEGPLIVTERRVRHPDVAVGSSPPEHMGLPGLLGGEQDGRSVGDRQVPVTNWSYVR